MKIDFKWEELREQTLDKAVFERILQARLQPFLSRLIDLPERLLVKLSDFEERVSAYVYPLGEEILLNVDLPKSDPANTHFWFRGDAPAHKMIYLWENRWEEEKSYHYKNVQTDPFEDWEKICRPSESMVSFESQIAMEIACGLGDLDVANAYLDRALAVGKRMEVDGLLKRYPPPDNELVMEEARVDQAIMIARLWRHGEWDPAQAESVIARVASWYLEKGRKSMWPDLLKSRALSWLRFCYIAGDYTTAKLIWSKLKKGTAEHDMSLWADVEREKSLPARASLIQGYLDQLPRNFNRSGLIMTGVCYQADLAMAIQRINQVPFEELRLGKVATRLRQKPIA